MTSGGNTSSIRPRIHEDIVILSGWGLAAWDLCSPAYCICPPRDQKRLAKEDSVSYLLGGFCFWSGFF